MNYTYTLHYKICDNILENISKDEDMHEVDIESFLTEPRRLKLAAVRQLQTDGYIHRVKPQSEPFKMTISVKGFQFHIDGGYATYLNELRDRQQLELYLLKSSISINKTSKNTNLIQAVIAFFVLLFVAISTCYQGKTYELEKSKNNNQNIDSTFNKADSSPKKPVQSEIKFGSL